MNDDSHRAKPPGYVRPIRLRTRILAVVGMLFGAFMIVSAFLQGGSILRGMAGVFFMAVAGYWAFASNQPDSLAVANARLRAAKAALERERESK